MTEPATQSSHSSQLTLVSARVTNFGCFRDSGTVPVDRLTALIAENENGKTTFLRALTWWGQPTMLFDQEDLWDGVPDLGSHDIVTLDFQLSPESIETLRSVDISDPLTHIRITRRSDNSYRLEDPKTGLIFRDPDPPPPSFTQYDVARAELLARLNEFGRRDGWELVQQIETSTPSQSPQATRSLLQDARAKFVPQYSDPERGNMITGLFTRALDTLPPHSTPPSLLEVLAPYTPRIVYFDDNIDHLSDSVSYDAVAADQQATKTMINLAKLADVDLLQIARSSGYERQRVGRVAEETLTAAFSPYWKNTTVKICLQFDETQMTVLIEHRGRTQRPSRRSSGLKWHLGFYVNFRANVTTDLSGAVLLLDEPGLRLHINQQPKLLALFKALAADGCTVIYTTHLPHMLLPDQPFSYRLIVSDPAVDGATVVIPNIAGMRSTADVLQPVRQVLGMGLADSIGLGLVNVIAEGLSERYCLLVMSDYCQQAGLIALPDYVTILPAGGSGRKMLPLAAMAIAEFQQVVILVDDDQAGRDTSELIKRALPEAVSVVRTHDEPDPTNKELEDLFDRGFYLQLVNHAHSYVDGYEAITLEELDPSVPICDAVRARFAELGLGDFQKLRVAVELERRRGLAEAPPDADSLRLFSGLFERLVEQLRPPA